MHATHQIECVRSYESPVVNAASLPRSRLLLINILKLTIDSPMVLICSLEFIKLKRLSSQGRAQVVSSYCVLVKMTLQDQKFNCTFHTFFKMEDKVSSLRASRQHSEFTPVLETNSPWRPSAYRISTATHGHVRRSFTTYKHKAFEGHLASFTSRDNLQL